MKTTIISAAWLLIGIAGLSSCSGEQQEAKTLTNDEKSIPVRTMPIEKIKWAAEIKTTGTIISDDQTVLSFKTGGVISEIMVDQGDYIRQGQVLARLDMTEINAGVEQAKIAQEKALRDYERVKRLKLEDAATLEQEENTRTALDMANQQLEVAKFNKQFSEIKATSNGYILQKMANPGQIAGPGTPVFLTTSSNNSSWKLEVGVSDREWSMLKAGDIAYIKSDLFPGEVISSKVIKKSRTANMRGGSFTADIELPSKLVKLAGLGMIASATLIPHREEDCWMIPYEALLDGDNGKGYVFTVSADKTAKKISVQTGRLDQDNIQVLSGLENQTSLIVSGSAYLKDGSSISIIE